MRIMQAQFRARPCRTPQQGLVAPHEPVGAYDHDLGTRTLLLRRVDLYQGVNQAIARTIGLQRGLDQYQDLTDNHLPTRDCCVTFKMER
jgi:hypothetical protein